uniref:Ankyrin repeat family protein n=1 Tax=Tanacetum cinerariifolium TaxID=118510 RepID=A0A699HHF2_TANCI|nr:ankyrin repeat family protein [Tanacetum cinerariifolium]
MAYLGTTSNIKNEIKEDHVTLFVAYDGKWEYDGKEWFFKNSKETSNKELPLCVTRLRYKDEISSDDDEISSDVGEESQKGSFSKDSLARDFDGDSLRSMLQKAVASFEWAI